jgi:MoxR-like ATPase
LTTGTPTHGRGSFAESFDSIVKNIEKVIQGKHHEIRLVVQTLVAGGHVLVEDVPGVGKTLLAKSLARSIDCTFHRIQFTPDLLPSDLTGVSVWDRDRGKFVFRRGPVFSNIVLGDEINRASPKTQAALLEAMEERQVTVDGITRNLSPPFMVIATQNPIEHEGTYPLPEAQLDRFMTRVTIGYPSREKELEMLDAHGTVSVFEDLAPVVTGDDVMALVRHASSTHVSPEVKGYIVDLAEATRRDPDLLLGASPRAALYLQRATRVRAVADGRDFVTPDDVKALLAPTWIHRMILRPEAMMRAASIEDVLERITTQVAVPGTADIR